MVNLFQATGLFLYTMRFFDIFKGYRKIPGAWNEGS